MDALNVDGSWPNGVMLVVTPLSTSFVMCARSLVASFGCGLSV